MRGMKVICGLITLLAVMVLAGCDSGSSGSGGASGVAVDPYIEGAVFQEKSADGKTLLQPESTASDAKGRFTFPKPLTEGSTVELKVSRKGLHKGDNFEGMLRRKVNKRNQGSFVVSPLTTLLASGLSEDEVIEILADAGVNLDEDELYGNPMEPLEEQGESVSDEQLKSLHANMAVNQFMQTIGIGESEIEREDLDDPKNFELLDSLIEANRKLLNSSEFDRIKDALESNIDGSDPLQMDDLLTSVVKTMRNVVDDAKREYANGTLGAEDIRREVQAALESAIEDVLELYSKRIGKDVPPVDEEPPAPEPTPEPEPTPDGQALYDAQCAECHRLGEYDTVGTGTDLAGREALVTDKLNWGHMGTVFSSAEIAAIEEWVAGTPVIPTPDPEPTPDPLPNGIALYERECQGCHQPLATNNIKDQSAAGIQQAIDANVGGMGMLILTPAEVQAISDSLSAPAPTPDPTPVDGQVLYDTYCSSCHAMGDYDTSGAPDLAGSGNLLIGKLEAGHMGLSLTADEHNALASWANANAAPTPTPDPNPNPTPVDGQTVYDTECASCHALGAYDTTGSPELGGLGNLVITKIEAGHMGKALTADELNALADWADANPAVVPTPDPTPTPVDGQTVYDNSCAGCHSVNEYDPTGAPDLASTGNLIAPKLAAGHNGMVLSAEEEIALADFVDLYPAVPSGPDYSNCTACHAQPPNGDFYPNTAGAHAVHAALSGIGNDCSSCHSGASHDDVLDVAFAATYDAKSGSATANADGTCSSVSCHGGQDTPDWTTGSLSVNTDCASCHIRSTSEFNGYYSGEHNKHRNYGCTVCHNTGKLETSHFSNLATSQFEGSPSGTIGGGSTSVGSYSGGTCSAVACHGSEKW